ncbi:uncharacterized protein EAE97_011782 [Botrytis byssoidea]|uniref:SIMPL domain-containing protein n=1 Tax=Botrytis byssoidea TaxID=139641 RepID=A0A9P5HPI2_9HELO|nr:uncharacterized protein EAE97_011782 [Botrytis byssoidea]KAF7919066.1 hypothetical protein EAE97_011782 [Botrytis byssoidea]
MSTPPLEIHIQGTSQVQLPAERGNLVVAVTSEGTSQTSVFEAVTQASNNLQALFKQLSTKPQHSSNSPEAASQEPPVTIYSMANLRTRSWQPPDYDSNGEPWARVHEASSHFEVTSIFIMPNAEIRSAAWSLTEETKKAAGILWREQAIKDAISKADDYARVLGREVAAAEVRDNGTNLKAVKRKGYAAMVPRRGVGADQRTLVDGLALEPQNVEIIEKVHVGFVSVDGV